MMGQTEASPESGMDETGEGEMALFAVTLAFSEDAARRGEVRPTHRAYLAELLQQGKLQQSGPFTDDTGALLIYDAADIAEVQEILSNDPYTPAGIIAGATIKEWNVVISRLEGQDKRP